MDKMKKAGLLGGAALLGASLVALSEERVRDFLKEKVHKHGMNKEEGKIFVDDLISETKRKKLNMEKNVVDRLHSSTIILSKELSDLSDRIDDRKIKELEEELERMRSMRKAGK
ncbi:hypothetical protein [Methanolobus profundi]|uniref:Polyhydroxyalkanoate synthesis regulator phasin n=1 Tax=Methanolobus profundi TaxID=487685 RepID=A0A1I4NLW9_9EURY|nr:hypothetical protein [Methanolobus profundi]SFM16365.1 Polyhydroxyalkanoate synthesis regulator phasin [Methanolobus profundi]